MSSYHSSFSYLGKNSKEDFNWIITHFSDNVDSGEVDTFLSTSAVYSDSYDGTRQAFYGAKYDTVATPQITVIKQDGTDFSINDNRKALRWLTGSKRPTWMDFYIGDEIKYRLLGRVKSVSQYKMDARIVGLVLTFESISPYGYSSLQTISKNIDGISVVTIPCESDDLYSYVYMNTTYKNISGDLLKITNNTTGDITEVRNLSQNEIITISDNMLITSDKPSKTFGNTFNFVFPRLIAGDNELIISGVGNITFQYIFPVKLGDIAIDLNAISTPICNSDGEIQIDTLDWSRISNTPTTVEGYGLTDVYTKQETDEKFDEIKTLLHQALTRIELLESLFGGTESGAQKLTKFTNIVDAIIWAAENGEAGDIVVVKLDIGWVPHIIEDDKSLSAICNCDGQEVILHLDGDDADGIDSSEEEMVLYFDGNYIEDEEGSILCFDGGSAFGI